jgi:hypothetical protein
MVIFNDEERPADRSSDHRFRWVSGWLFLGELLSSRARLRFASQRRF